jgi:chromosome segregation ATPase
VRHVRPPRGHRADASNTRSAILAALTDHGNSQQTNLDVQQASLGVTSRELADLKLQRLADENTARDLMNQLTEAQSSLMASKSSCEEQGRQLQEVTQRLLEVSDVTDVLRQQLNVAQAQATEAINVAATLRQERETLRHEGNALRQE